MTNVVPTPQTSTHHRSARNTARNISNSNSSISNTSISNVSPQYALPTTTDAPTVARRRRLGAMGFVAAAMLGTFATTSGAPAQAQLGGAAGKTVNVSLAKLKFNPKKVEIKKGDSLNFVWKESVAHNIVFENKGMKSKTQNKGAWLVKLDKVGVFKFKCTLHPGMEGVVAVK
jgi:plastocyanin